MKLGEKIPFFILINISEKCIAWKNLTTVINNKLVFGKRLFMWNKTKLGILHCIRSFANRDPHVKKPKASEQNKQSKKKKEKKFQLCLQKYKFYYKNQQLLSNKNP